MKVRSQWERGTTYIDGMEIAFNDFLADVPDVIAYRLLVYGDYTVVGKKWRPLDQCKRLLMIRGGGLGDVLLTHCVRLAFKRRNPKALITLLCDSKYRGMVQFDPTLDGTIKIGMLEPNRYDHIINMNNCEFQPAFVTAHKASLLGMSAGIKIEETDKKLFYRTVKAERKWAKRVLGSNGNFVGVVLRSTCDSKHMPYGRTKQTCHELVRRGLTPVIFDHHKKTGGKFPGVDARGRYNVRECASLIERCATILTPDTGFLHLATALGGPVVAYFGSIGHKLVLTQKNIITVTPKVDCYPCNSFGCPAGHKDCLKYDPKYLADVVAKVAKK